jgi:radical SAM protein with 4Fe4S-binding SPASM domain
MKNDKLKPFVHKIKGAKNYAFYDMLNGNFYHIVPTCRIEDVRKQLQEAGLIFESETFVPFKTMLNVINKEDKLLLRKLQIRLNGNGEDTCWRRTKNKTKKVPMSKDIIERVISKFQDIPIQKLIIEAESSDDGLLFALINKLDFSEAELFVASGISQGVITILNEMSHKKLEIKEIRNIPIKEINVIANDFFYQQVFNPCLGHQIAVDTEGEIKPCLWWSSDLGNIHDPGSIKSMILSGKFDKYWEITKDEIEVCKDCEYRYNCMDCRINTSPLNEKLTAKPTFCRYNPYTGEGDEK